MTAPSEFLRAREADFAAFCRRFSPVMLSPLVAGCEIRPDLFARYRAAVEAYNDASRDHDFANLTPAGMLMPKQEIERLYTEVTSRFLDIGDWLDAGDLIAGWNIPAIRHKTANPNPEHLKRPYVSEDAHADAWIGWDSGSLLFMTPVLGDTRRNWVRFYRHPASFDASWMQKLGSFRDDKALAMFRQCEPLPRHYEPGFLYVVDISVVHQTIRDAGASWRVGMEMMGYRAEPAPESFGAGTKFSAAEAEALRAGNKRIRCDLKMSEIGDYTAAKRAIDIRLVDAEEWDLTKETRVLAK